MKGYDIVLIVLAVIFMSIAGFWILQESPAEKACKEYNKTLIEGNK